MRSKTKCRVGDKVNSLLCLEEDFTTEKPMLLVRCDCGMEKWILRKYFSKHGPKTCGCASEKAIAKFLEKYGVKERHGMTNTRVHGVWKDMKWRCNSSKENYGGRGISYHESWEVFENFYNDMGDCPDGYSIDRIDVNGDYTKENCRWANLEAQSRNKRKTKVDGKCLSLFKGVTKSRDKKKFSCSIKLCKKKHNLGYSFDEELLALRYDYASMMCGYTEATNQKLGLVEGDLESKYPCDFLFWNKYVNKMPQPIKFVN